MENGKLTIETIIFKQPLIAQSQTGFVAKFGNVDFEIDGQGVASSLSAKIPEGDFKAERQR
jgi:hypothetical protein